MGYIVGVIGDGVNDLFVLKKVDLGIVMNKFGFDVLKDVVFMIFFDDNFVSIVCGIWEG